MLRGRCVSLLLNRLACESSGTATLMEFDWSKADPQLALELLEGVLRGVYWQQKMNDNTCPRCSARCSACAGIRVTLSPERDVDKLTFLLPSAALLIHWAKPGDALK